MGINGVYKPKNITARPHIVSSSNWIHMKSRTKKNRLPGCPMSMIKVDHLCIHIPLEIHVIYSWLVVSTSLKNMKVSYG